MIHEAGSVCALWAMGVTQHIGGSDTSTAISNLLLVTGNYGKPGAGSYPLRGHNNVQGASDFGSMPDSFPGYEKVTDEKARKKYEQGWGTDLPQEIGMTNHEMIEGIHSGKLKSMYLKGEEMGLVDSNINHVHAAFEKLDFFVVQDIFLSRTAEFADVVLPASPSLEKEGTFTNTGTSESSEKPRDLHFNQLPLLRARCGTTFCSEKNSTGHSTIRPKSSQILQICRRSFWIGMQKNYPAGSGRSSH
jgi:formate dehydrogenase major subunit